MRLVSVTLWTSNTLLVVAGGAFAWARTHPAAAVPPQPPPVVQILRFRPAELSASRASAGSTDASGWIEFGLAPGETLAGVVGAQAYAVEDGAPELELRVDLAPSQVKGRLDARKWLEREGVPADAFLSFNLLVLAVGGREEHRQGWARIDVVSLRTHGLSVDAPARETATIEVRTAEGQPIPGALVVVDPQDISQAGLVSQFALTGEDGAVVVSGLSKSAKFMASLRDGVGPDARPVTAALARDGAPTELRTAIAGKWQFVRHHLHFALAGSSTRLTELKATDPGAAAAWAVERWAPPGRGFDAPFWIMLPASDSPRAVPAHLVFANRTAVDVADLRTSARLVFSPKTHDVKVLDRAARQSGPAASPLPR